MQRASLLALVALVIAPLPTASAEPFVLVEDAKGDAGLDGTAAAPAGAEAWDLVDVTLTDETPQALTLLFHVAPTAFAPPAGEVALHFRVGESTWLVGWTTIAFPAPPFVYQGGFYCPTDDQGMANTEACGSMQARLGEDVYEITLERAKVQAQDAGLVLDEAWAYADLYNSDGTKVRVDRTPLGLAYAFGTGNSTAMGEPEAPDAAQTVASPEVASTTALHEALAPEGSASSSGLFAAVSAALLVGLVRRRAPPY